MKIMRLFLFVALSVIVTSGGSNAEDMGHTHTDHGDSSSVHDGGWYCQLCDEHFDTQQDMDEHAEDMGHTHTDHGDSSSVHDGD